MPANIDHDEILILVRSAILALDHATRLATMRCYEISVLQGSAALISQTLKRVVGRLRNHIMKLTDYDMLFLQDK